MEKATPATVLGDFSGVSVENFGVVSTFSRAGDKFMVRTDGPDGALQDYEITYTFGVDPLQQYLIGFPDGRKDLLKTENDPSLPRQDQFTASISASFQLRSK